MPITSISSTLHNLEAFWVLSGWRYTTFRKSNNFNNSMHTKVNRYNTRRGWLGQWYVCVLHRWSSCSLARAMDGRIMRCGIISSCQSAATSLLSMCSLWSSAMSSTWPLHLPLCIPLIIPLQIYRNVLNTLLSISWNPQSISCTLQYTVSQKVRSLCAHPYRRPILTHCSNYRQTYYNKFTTGKCITNPTNTVYVATLTCESWSQVSLCSLPYEVCRRLILAISLSIFTRATLC